MFVLQFVLVCRAKSELCTLDPIPDKLLYVQEAVTLQKKYSNIFASEN